jgi:hypothetical protein
MLSKFALIAAEVIRAEGHNVTFEFISLGAHQYNGANERMYATRSILNQVLPLHIRRGFGAEASKTATDMRNFLVYFYGYQV